VFRRTPSLVDVASVFGSIRVQYIRRNCLLLFCTWLLAGLLIIMAVVQTLKATALTSNATAPAPISGFRTLESQVAGHFALRSKPCFLVDKDGYVLKMVDFTRSGSTGFVETAFFESIFNSDESEKDFVELREFLPSYHGLQQLSIGGEHFWYLKLENLVSGFAKPSVMDIKIGQITYDPFAERCKAEREMLKYEFQEELGFRILGSKSFKIKAGITEFLDKSVGKKLKPNEILSYISTFLDLKNVPERARLVSEIISALDRIFQWFSHQERIKFYSSSILIAFDGEKTQYNSSSRRENGSSVQRIDVVCAETDFSISRKDVVVRLIDFPHTYIDLKGQKSLDVNYIYGLKNLIQIFKRLASLYE